MKQKVKGKKQPSKITVVEKSEYGKTMSALVENAETGLMLKEIQGDIIDKLAYSFKGQGKMVEGLTFWGLKSCAEYDKRNKWIPQWTKPEYQQFGDQILLTIGCINSKTKLTEWGNCIFSPRERFGERKALTNTKRYALDKHIPVAQKISFVKFIKNNKPKQV